MKKVRVEDAVGLKLCHDLTEMKDGFKGAAFKRGHVIREEDIPHMLDIGKRTVFVWEDNATGISATANSSSVGTKRIPNVSIIVPCMRE